MSSASFLSDPFNSELTPSGDASLFFQTIEPPPSSTSSRRAASLYQMVGYLLFVSARSSLLSLGRQVLIFVFLSLLRLPSQGSRVRNGPLPALLSLSHHRRRSQDHDQRARTWDDVSLSPFIPFRFSFLSLTRAFSRSCSEAASNGSIDDSSESELAIERDPRAGWAVEERSTLS